MLILPAAVGLYLLADPLIALFFEGGEFTPKDTMATAGILRMYAVAAVGICTYRVLLPVFFALKDPYLPLRLSLVVMVLKLPVALGLMYPLGFGLDGLPLSHAVTVSLEVLVMIWVLSKRMGGWAPGFWSQQMRILAASAGMGLVVWQLRDHAEGMGVLLVCGAEAGAYGILSVLLRVRETRTVLQKLLRRGPPPPPGGIPPGAPAHPPPRPPASSS